MSYWDYEEPMWEPSEADELFDNIKRQLIDAAKSSIKSDMESLKERNEFLEKRNKELENKIHEVANKERELQYKEKNLKQEVEKEFYATAIDDLFKDVIENSQVWFAENLPHKPQKCDLCDDKRRLVYTWPNGQTTTVACKCSKFIYWFEPQEAYVDQLKYNKYDSRYSSKRSYSLYRSYTPRIDGYDYDRCYSEFKILHVVDSFNDNTIKLYNEKQYGERIGFTNKEECQKFCDWLNKKAEEEVKD